MLNRNPRRDDIAPARRRPNNQEERNGVDKELAMDLPDLVVDACEKEALHKKVDGVEVGFCEEVGKHIETSVALAPEDFLALSKYTQAINRGKEANARVRVHE